MNKMLIMTMMLMIIMATILINGQARQNQDQQIAVGDTVTNPICAVNLINE